MGRKRVVELDIETRLILRVVDEGLFEAEAALLLAELNRAPDQAGKLFAIRGR